MNYRHEYKYQLDAKQEAILLIRTAGLLARDSHVGKYGNYLIRSLYFDDLHNSCLWDNVCGSNPRSKFRIRYYNNNLSYICLEKKTKYNGMTHKESCELSIEEVKSFIMGNVPEITDATPDIKKRLFTEIKIKNLLPKIIVTYQRVPFIYPGGNVRITFDQNLSSSNEIDKFLCGNYMMRPVYPMGQSIMEVKWDEVLPQHIKKLLQLENLRWTAFSKYYISRMLHL